MGTVKEIRVMKSYIALFSTVALLIFVLIPPDYINYVGVLFLAFVGVHSSTYYQLYKLSDMEPTKIYSEQRDQYHYDIFFGVLWTTIITIASMCSMLMVMNEIPDIIWLLIGYIGIHWLINMICFNMLYSKGKKPYG